MELDSTLQANKAMEEEKKRKVSGFIVDETLIRVGRELVWLWIAIEPIEKVILDMHISFERSILVAEQFLQELIRKYGKYPVSTDGGTWYPSQACKFLKLKHHTHSSYMKRVSHRANHSVHKR
jgi:putative transposase